MLRNDDSDIDALLGSVVGNNGQPAEFPPAPVVPIRPARVKRSKAEPDTSKMEELSAELAEQLETNEKKRVIIDPRTVPARFSRLREMSKSALHYWSAVQDDREDTLAMRFGRGFHALALGQPVKRWTGKNRNSNDYKTYVKNNPGVEVLMPKEWDRAHGMFEAIQRHPIAHDVLFGEGTVLEETIEWEFLGKKCTSRPDARLGTERLVDLKTTRCAEPRKFERDAMWRGYHAQFSFYGRAIAERFGSFPKQSLCVAVETVKPYAITVLELTPDALSEGEKCWRLWFERLLVCEAANSWPAYTEVIERLDVAPNDDVPLIIDGEKFSFDDE